MLFCAFSAQEGDWDLKRTSQYKLYYKDADKFILNDVGTLIQRGMQQTRDFFHSGFRHVFAVYIHPARRSLDSTWQMNWSLPDFKSECWMVASGEAKRLDLLSPARWGSEACEHQYSNRMSTQNPFTHELVHVYHAQLNPSPDFSQLENLDWLVEGLATYVSGQCDSVRLAGVMSILHANKGPKALSEFWTGQHKYGLSGSMLMYIDKKFGRQKLLSLLSLTKCSEVLSAFGTTETDLINNWRDFVLTGRYRSN